jgi:hypothetical protein
MRKYLIIYEKAVSQAVYDFATDPFWISSSMRKIWFSFYQCIVMSTFRSFETEKCAFLTSPKNIQYSLQTVQYRFRDLYNRDWGQS